MPLYRLNPKNFEFPDGSEALTDPAGLLAIDGDLHPERLLSAYRSGIFPWSGPADPLLWWAPDPRAVFFPHSMHFSRRLLRSLRQSPFQVSLNQDFSAVVAGCAAPREPQGQTWILPALQNAYLALHQQGHAHSIEIWQQRRLVGGLFGVSIGRAFFAESMFSQITNASKLALLALRRSLLKHQYLLIDTQFKTPHLASLGVIELPRDHYQQLLQQAISEPSLRDWPHAHRTSAVIDSAAFAIDPEGEQPWDF